MVGRIVLSIIGSVLLGAVVAGCSSGGEDDDGTAEVVVIGQVAPDTGPPIGRSVDPVDGLADPERWPSACLLVDENVLREVFPQAEDIEATPSARTVVAAGAQGRAGSIAVPEADCTVRVGLPLAGLGLEDASGGVVFETSVVAVGDVEVVARLVEGSGGERIDVDGYDCRRTSTLEILCNQGEWAFRLGLELPAHDAPKSTYEVRGATVSYEDGAEREVFIEQQVLIPIVGSTLARDV